MMPTYFINHGGGPCFFLPPGPMRDAWSGLEGYLRAFASTPPERPRAIVVVSGHWDEDRPTVNAGAAPPLLFDYGGFPQAMYQLQWPAPGAPALASELRDLLHKAGIESGEDVRRGWDHGVFVPLKVMFPGADIPVVQVSLQRGLDPATHLAVGRALKPVRDEGVLIIGSGQSYHNMRGFALGGDRVDPGAEAFDAWLREAMTDPRTRERSLTEWTRAPGARIAQPREEHLLPLMVAAGAAPGEAGEVAFSGRAMGKPISGVR